MKTKKRVQKRDGSGKGIRKNKGRGGCSSTKKISPRRKK